MTGNDETTSLVAIERVRELHRKCAMQCAAVGGVTPEDNAIAAVYATFDIAQAFVGGDAETVAWLRATIDLIEASASIETVTVQ